MIVKLKAQRRFTDMKIYRTVNMPQIIEMRDLEFTFGPENQTMCLRLPFRTVCCHLDAFAKPGRHRCTCQHFFEKSYNVLL